MLGFVGQDLAEPEVGGTFIGNTTTAVPEKYNWAELRSSFISISARFLASKSNIFHVFFRYYTFNQFVNMRESRNFEFKTGGGAYPIHILPEVR